MVLVDTSIWVSHLRYGDAHLETLLKNAQVVSHPFIIGELACGKLRGRKEILSLLQALPSTPVITQEELLYFIEQKSLAGAGIGFVDAHLLASAQLFDVPVWTSDRQFKRATERLKLSYPAAIQ